MMVDGRDTWDISIEDLVFSPMFVDTIDEDLALIHGAMQYIPKKYTVIRGGGRK